MTALQRNGTLWQEPYRIHSYDVDIKGQATLPILFQFMQETAWKHAEHLKLGFDVMFAQNLIWILARQLIRIDRFPKLGDDIVINTWPTGNDRLFCYRDFKILTEQREEIGRATTVWFVVDINTRKPQRTSSYFHLDIGECEQVLPGQRKNRLATLEQSQSKQSFEVKYKDLDFHEHVNNVRYIEWVLDTFPLDFQKRHNLRELEIHYLNEALYQDALTVHSGNIENSNYLHNIVREADQKELCKAKTLWQSNSCQEPE